MKRGINHSIEQAENLIQEGKAIIGTEQVQEAVIVIGGTVDN